MALGTTTRVVASTFGNKKVRTYDVQLTSGANYTTGGETITPGAVGMKKIEQVLSDAGAKNAAGTSTVPVRYDYTNSKLQAYRYDGASVGKAFLEEVAAGVDLSAFTARLTFIGA